MKTLITVPTPETRARLENIFMNSPFSIDFDKLLVPLAFVPSENADTMLLNQTSVYTAKVTDYRILWDDNRKQAELVAVLASDDMRKRASELGMAESFQFKLIVLPYSPSQSTSVRNFNVSIADTLVMREHPFTFSKEYLLQ